MRVFVINLVGDEPRRRHMQGQLAAAGLTAEFVPAVDGRTLGPADRAMVDRRRTTLVYGSDLLDTEIGCYLSHYRLYERILREDIDVALIMEDDIEIEPGLAGVVEALLADPAPEWLVVRFEAQRHNVREPRHARDLGHVVRDLGGAALYRLDVHVLGLGAYLIRKPGAERMVRYGARIFMPIDQTMDRYWENGIAPYLVRPLMVRQQADLGSRIGARPAGRHIGHPLGLRLLRRVQRVSDSARKRLYRVQRLLSLS